MTISVRLLLLAWVTLTLPAQIAWNSIPSAPNGGVMSYDSWRRRVVAVGNSQTFEFDGVSWQLTATGPLVVGWSMFDETRGVTVVGGSTNLTTPPETWEWDGQTWQSGGALFPYALASAALVTYHAGLGGILIARQEGVTHLELYLWNGTSLTLLPMPLAPPMYSGADRYYYQTWTVDAASDRIVMFGRTKIVLPNTVIHVAQNWEWDPVNGWLDLGVSGPLPHSSTIWFDRQRNRVLRVDYSSTSVAAYSRSSPATWISMGVQGSPRPTYACYDWHANRVYYGPSLYAFIHDVNPATYEVHAPGCPAPAAPTLDLTDTWTRAWLGGTLSVDIGNLTSSIAILAMGFDDQNYNGNPLPLALGAHGMPQCFLNVDSQASLIAPANNGTATVAIPIPTDPALLGATFYQQAFAPVPGANALGMLASPSTVGTVGQSH